MSGDRHSHQPGDVEKAIGAVMARLACEHSHGMRSPKSPPCTKHAQLGAWWGYVIEGHVTDVALAIAGVDVLVLRAAVSIAAELEEEAIAEDG